MPVPKQIKSLLEEARERYVFSAYSLYFERAGESVSVIGGMTSHWPDAREVKDDTWFDIGSITKSVVTASLYARQLQAGRLKLEDELGTHLPELDGSPLGSRTLLELLNHCSGLVGWYPLFRETDSEGWLAWVRSREGQLLEAEARTKAVYSDVGFLILGAVLERMGGSLLKLFTKEVAEPLALREVAYGPRNKESSAATEFCLVRNRLLQGEVFDENSFFLGQGTTAHAGLFATARGLAPWCREWLRAVKGKSSWLGEPIATRFTHPTGLVPGSTWALGWETKSLHHSTAGDVFSPSSFGHLGYPGCSIWPDPVVEGFALFLTNRIHPSRWDERIRDLRPKIHDLIARYWRLRD